MYVYVFPAGFMFVHGYLFDCLCVITGQKIEQTGGPKTFLGLVWPKLVDNLARI